MLLYQRIEWGDTVLSGTRDGERGSGEGTPSGEGEFMCGCDETGFKEFQSLGFLFKEQLTFNPCAILGMSSGIVFFFFLSALIGLATNEK